MSIITKNIPVEDPVASILPPIRIYEPRLACFEVEVGVFYGLNRWPLKRYLKLQNHPTSQQSLNFNWIHSDGLNFTSAERSALVKVAKDYAYFERNTVLNCWDTVICSQRKFVKPLFVFVSDRGRGRISELSLDALKDFIDAGTAAARNRRINLLWRLHELYRSGEIADGPAFNIRLHVETARVAASQSPQTKTRPLGKADFLTGFAAALKFIRRWKSDIVAELNNVASGSEPDLARFMELAPLYPVANFSFWQVTREFQRAVYIVVASTIAGRSAEFLNLRRGCCTVANIKGRTVIAIDRGVTKKPGTEVETRISIGMRFTKVAIDALEEVLVAHPQASSSQNLFATLFQGRDEDRNVGEPITSCTMRHGVSRFVQLFAGIPHAPAKAVTVHRFRASVLGRLSQETYGAAAAFRASNACDFGIIYDYTMPETVSDAIHDNLNDIVLQEVA